MQPETKYARLGGDRIAYQVLGEGPPDLVMTTGNYSHVDMVWEDPGIALFLRTLASFSRLVEEFGGRLVKTTGDGILATFEGPGRAIQCAVALREELAGIGVGIRTGLHTGEVELRGDDIGGLAVHIAARVMAAAGSGEILVSRTVRDLVAGSDVTLEDRGIYRLKGLDGDWQLLAVARP